MPPASKKSVALAEPGDGGSCEDWKRKLAGTASLAASVLLVIDVVTDHGFTLTLVGAGVALMLLSALLNSLSSVFYARTTNEATKDCSAAKLNLLVILNMLVMDAFIYEEETYNHWGHSANVIKEERTFAFVVELFVAGLIIWNINTQFKKDKPKKQSKPKPKGTGMV